MVSLSCRALLLISLGSIVLVVWVVRLHRLFRGGVCEVYVVVDGEVYRVSPGGSPETLVRYSRGELGRLARGLSWI